MKSETNASRTLAAIVSITELTHPIITTDEEKSPPASSQDDIHDIDAGNFRPSVFYFRKALRGSWSRERAVVVGLVVCYELEQLKAWVREQGMIPPKWVVDPQEAAEKGY